ncbi:MAG TPA: addiction module protein [Thermoanaerobaculia bacterium]|nr:addiction module protein [Thermoanaerobaculia bacterium]
MARNYEDVEAEALDLPDESRARLAESLLASLALHGSGDPEVANDWLDEAERRDREMDEGRDQGRQASDLFPAMRKRIE